MNSCLFSEVNNQIEGLLDAKHILNQLKFSKELNSINSNLAAIFKNKSKSFVQSNLELFESKFKVPNFIFTMHTKTLIYKEHIKLILSKIGKSVFKNAE